MSHEPFAAGRKLILPFFGIGVPEVRPLRSLPSCSDIPAVASNGNFRHEEYSNAQYPFFNPVSSEIPVPGSPPPGARECFPEEEFRQSLHGGFRRKAVSPEPSRTVPCRGVVKGLTEELLFSAQKKKNLFFFLFPLDKTARIGYN